MRPNAMPAAIVAASFLLAAGAARAESTRPQTFEAVKQALLDGRSVTMIIDPEMCGQYTNRPKIRVVIPTAEIVDHGDKNSDHILFTDRRAAPMDNDFGIVNKYDVYYMIPDDKGDDVIVQTVSYEAPLSATKAQYVDGRLCTTSNGGVKLVW